MCFKSIHCTKDKLLSYEKQPSQSLKNHILWRIQWSGGGLEIWSAYDGLAKEWTSNSIIERLEKGAESDVTIGVIYHGPDKPAPTNRHKLTSQSHHTPEFLESLNASHFRVPFRLFD